MMPAAKSGNMSVTFLGNLSTKEPPTVEKEHWQEKTQQ